MLSAVRGGGDEPTLFFGKRLDLKGPADGSPGAEAVEAAKASQASTPSSSDWMRQNHCVHAKAPPRR